MSGTGQGDIQAPPLFNVVINFAMELAMISKSVSGGFTLQKRLSSRIPAKYVTDADYADDLAVLDDSKDGLQESTNAIADYCSLGGLTINVKKTKCMNIAKYHKQRRFTENEVLDIDVYGNPIDQVTSFTYLGSVISSDGSLDDELTTRIGKASGAFNTINNIWVNKGISLKTKVRIYKAAIITILTYGAEVWSPTSSQISRLEVFNHRCLRRILKIKWDDFVSNAAVRDQTVSCKVEEQIRCTRLRWFGHLARMSADRLPNFLLSWYPSHGQRSVGAPRCNWRDSVIADIRLLTDNNEMTFKEAIDLAQNRSRWFDLTRGNATRGRKKQHVQAVARL